MIKVAVIGLGYLGSIHAKIYKRMENVDLVAVCDVDPAKSELAKELGALFFTDYMDIPRVDAVSIVTPTINHFDVGQFFLGSHIPCLIEKPLASSLEQGHDLVEKSERLDMILQVGQVERFNPAIRAAADYLAYPWFVEADRVSPYPFRSTDVSVVLDLMIHDIDLVVSLVDEDPYRIWAEGMPIFSETEDIANTRIEFPGGCVANLTASRVSLKKERKIRMFQSNSYLSLDLLNGCGVHIEKVKGNIPVTPENISSFMKKTDFVNDGIGSLDAELASFIDCVMANKQPVVDGKAGLRALCVAKRVLSALKGPPREPSSVIGLA